MASLRAFLVEWPAPFPHVYLQSDDGLTWGCNGPASGGTVVLEVPNANIARANAASDRMAGIMYHRDGVGVHIANRILLAATPDDDSPRVVSTNASSMIRALYFMYLGPYGRGYAPWAKQNNLREVRPKMDDTLGNTDEAAKTELGLDILIAGANGGMIPSFQIASLVIPESKVSEGVLVKDTSAVWHSLARRVTEDWRIAFQIPPDKWEEMAAGAFKKAGYEEVILTPRSRDFGRDIIAIKKGVGAIKIVGSIKAYAPDRPATYDDIRSLVGVISMDQTASKGIIATTSHFPPRVAEDLFIPQLMPYRLELMDGEKLRQWLLSLLS